MSRNTRRFLTLVNLIAMFDKDTSSYYWQCVSDECDKIMPELITESILFEMECSLQTCTSEVTECAL